MTTYQEAFMLNRYAQIATQIGQSRGKPAEWMHKTAAVLFAENASREQTKGKPMSDDHLRQRVGQLAKES